MARLGRFGVWARANPLKVFSVVLVLAVVSGVAVYAYLGLLTPQAGRATITSPPIEFSMELDKAEYLLGENVTIKLSLKNISNRTITLYWSKFYAHYDMVMYFDFYVMHSNTTLVYQWTEDHIALPAVLEETLNPGEQLISIYVWHQTTAYPDRAQVPAGTYFVRGFTRRVGLTVEGQTSVITLETPSIAFIVNNGRERRYGEFHNPDSTFP